MSDQHRPPFNDERTIDDYTEGWTYSQPFGGKPSPNGFPDDERTMDEGYAGDWYPIPAEGKGLSDDESTAEDFAQTESAWSEPVSSTSAAKKHSSDGNTEQRVEALMASIWGDWKIEGDPLGVGSFGKVYKVSRTEFGDTMYAAVKHLEIPADQKQVEELYANGITDDASITAYYENAAKKLRAEIQFMDQVKGLTNFVSYEDSRILPKEDGYGYDVLIRMELLTSLDKPIKQQHSFQPQEVVKIGTDICTALEYLQGMQIVHRDIKPQNILFNSLGNYKLGDFGISKAVGHDNTVMTSAGTEPYMSPEIRHGERAGFASDQYSLGIVLYRLLNANRAPFLPAEGPITNEDMEKALARRMSGETLPPPAYADERLSAVILRACSFRPEDRYPSAADLKRALLDYLNPVPEPEPEPEPPAEPIGTVSFFAPAVAAATAASASIEKPAAEPEGTMSIFAAPPEEKASEAKDVPEPEAPSADVLQAETSAPDPIPEAEEAGTMSIFQPVAEQEPEELPDAEKNGTLSFFPPRQTQTTDDQPGEPPISGPEPEPAPISEIVPPVKKKPEKSAEKSGKKKETKAEKSEKEKPQKEAKSEKAKKAPPQKEAKPEKAKKGKPQKQEKSESQEGEKKKKKAIWFIIPAAVLLLILLLILIPKGNKNNTHTNPTATTFRPASSTPAPTPSATPEPTEDPEEVEPVSLKAEEQTLEAIGDTFRIELENLPETAEVRYESSDPEVLSVTEDGLVTALRPGDASVAVTVKDGEAEQTLECLFHIPLRSMITASAGEGGTITPEGEMAIIPGESMVFEIIPDDGYMVTDVLVNGESIGTIPIVTILLENDPETGAPVTNVLADVDGNGPVPVLTCQEPPEAQTIEAVFVPCRVPRNTT